LDLFESSFPKDLEIYEESHALIDKLGKTYCKINESMFWLNRISDDLMTDLTFFA